MVATWRTPAGGDGAAVSDTPTSRRSRRHIAMVVVTIEHIHADRVTAPAGKPADRVRQRVPVPPPLHTVGRHRADLRPIEKHPIAGHPPVVTRRRPNERHTRRIRRRHLQLAHSRRRGIPLTRRRSKTRLATNHKRDNNRHKRGGGRAAKSRHAPSCRPAHQLSRSPFGGIGLRFPVGANTATMMLDKASKGLHKGRECVVRPLVEFPLHPTGRVDQPAWRCCGRRSNGELDVGSPALAQADSLPARIGRKPWLFGRWREPGDEGDVAWPANSGAARRPHASRRQVGSSTHRRPRISCWSSAPVPGIAILVEPCDPRQRTGSLSPATPSDPVEGPSAWAHGRRGRDRPTL